MHKRAVDGEPHVTLHVLDGFFLHHAHNSARRLVHANRYWFIPDKLEENLWGTQQRLSMNLWEKCVLTLHMFDSSRGPTSPCPSATSAATAALRTAAPTSAVISRILITGNNGFSYSSWNPGHECHVKKLDELTYRLMDTGCPFEFLHLWYMKQGCNNNLDLDILLKMVWNLYSTFDQFLILPLGSCLQHIIGYYTSTSKKTSQANSGYAESQLRKPWKVNGKHISWHNHRNDVPWEKVHVICLIYMTCLPISCKNWNK